MSIAIFSSLVIIFSFMVLRFIRVFPQSHWEDDMKITEERSKAYQRSMQVNRILLNQCANLVVLDEKAESVYRDTEGSNDDVINMVALTSTFRQEMYERLQYLELVTDGQSNLKIRSPASDANVIHVNFG